MLRELKAYWEAKRGSRRMPERADIDVAELKAHMPSLFLVDVLEGGRDFRFRLLGTNLTSRFGRDSTGKTFSTTYDRADAEATAWLLMVYRSVVERRLPVLSSAPLHQVGRDYLRGTAIHLPLSRDGDAVDMILGETHFHAAT